MKDTIIYYKPVHIPKNASSVGINMLFYCNLYTYSSLMVL
jgi:hypothetical protein